VSYYDPPNLTYPFGSYICVVDIDRGTGEVKIRRFVAVDDCGNIINPMIVEGQIHGGLTMGLAPALYEEISYDEQGNIRGGSFIDYLVPAVERRSGDRPPVTPSPPPAREGVSGQPQSARHLMPTRWSTCGTWACATWTSPSRRPRSGSSCASTA
jgi:carbon-monoxide dehydrogenase large subunit